LSFGCHFCPSGRCGRFGQNTCAVAEWLSFFFCFVDFEQPLDTESLFILRKRRSMTIVSFNDGL
jgi:hypothetical protein